MVATSTIHELVEFFHAFVGFCVDPCTMLSPLSKYYSCNHCPTKTPLVLSHKSTTSIEKNTLIMLKPYKSCAFSCQSRSNPFRESNTPIGLTFSKYFWAKIGWFINFSKFSIIKFHGKDLRKKFSETLCLFLPIIASLNFGTFSVSPIRLLYTPFCYLL